MQENLWINYNGRICAAKDPLFPFNRAMSYGDGLFESIRIHDGEILFFNDHLDRMIRAMRALHIEVPAHYDAFFFHKQIVDLALKEQTGSNARARISIFRSGKGLYEPQANSPEYFIQITNLPHGYGWKDNAYQLGIFHDVPKNFSSVSAYKTLSALPYILAAIYRKEQQLDDCLLLNSSGNIADATSSNIFWIENNIVYTTPVSDGGVDGILRKQLLQLLEKQHVTCSEKSITPEALSVVDEIFLTNVGHGIRPVTKFSGRIFSTRKTKEIAELLNSFLLK